nr:hypothetical protein [Candidatus Sigynarchaeum springense]
MPLDKGSLIDFLKVLDGELEEHVTIVAAGGTAMTLLDLKTSTVDVDFTIPANNKAVLERILRTIPHGFKIDMWANGLVFSQQLPPDYLERSIEIITLDHVVLKALDPVDIETSDFNFPGHDIEAFRWNFKLLSTRKSARSP